MKHFFLKGSNNSGSVVFENDGFGEIKDHSIITTPLQELSSAMEGLGVFLSYVKM